jgi:hypothetical protein
MQASNGKLPQLRLSEEQQAALKIAIANQKLRKGVNLVQRLCSSACVRTR